MAATRTTFTPLTKGRGTWAGELEVDLYVDVNKQVLPVLDPGDVPVQNLTSPISYRTRSAGGVSAYPVDGELALPKTYLTRKGALLLFTAPNNVELTPEQKHLVQKGLAKSSNTMHTKFGTLEKFARSVLEFGKDDYETGELATPQREAVFLKFVRGLDSYTSDSRARPGGDPASYLRDLRATTAGSKRAHVLGGHATGRVLGLQQLSPGLEPDPAEMLSAEADRLIEKYTVHQSRTSSVAEQAGHGHTPILLPHRRFSVDKLTSNLKSNTFLGRPASVGNSIGQCITKPGDVARPNTPSSRPSTGMSRSRPTSASTPVAKDILQEGSSYTQDMIDITHQPQLPYSYPHPSNQSQNSLELHISHDSDTASISSSLLQEEDIDISKDEEDLGPHTRNLSYTHAAEPLYAPYQGAKGEYILKRSDSSSTQHSGHDLQDELPEVRVLTPNSATQEDHDTGIEPVISVEIRSGSRASVASSHSGVPSRPSSILKSRKLSESPELSTDTNTELENNRDLPLTPEPSDDLDVTFDILATRSTDSPIELNNRFPVTDRQIETDTTNKSDIANPPTEPNNQTLLENLRQSPSTEPASPEPEVTKTINRETSYVANVESLEMSDTTNNKSVENAITNDTANSFKEENSHELDSKTEENIKATRNSVTFKDLQTSDGDAKEDIKTETKKQDAPKENLASQTAKELEKLFGPAKPPRPPKKEKEHKNIKTNKRRKISAAKGKDVKVDNNSDLPLNLACDEATALENPNNLEAETKNEEEKQENINKEKSVEPITTTATERKVSFQDENKTSAKKEHTKKRHDKKEGDTNGKAKRHTPKAEAKKEVNKDAETESEVAQGFEDEDEFKTGGLTMEDLQMEQSFLRGHTNTLVMEDDSDEDSKESHKKKRGRKEKKVKSEDEIRRIEEEKARMRQEREEEKERHRKEREEEKMKRLQEALALQEKIKHREVEVQKQEEQANERKQQLQKDIHQMSEAAEIARQAEEDARQKLAAQRKASREEREAKRKGEMGKKKQEAAEKRDRERRLAEEARVRERMMLEKISTGDERRRMREEDHRMRQEMEWQLQQQMIDDEERLIQQAMDEEERVTAMEMLADEEAMARLVADRRQAEDIQRALEEEADQLSALQDNERMEMLREQEKLDELQRTRDEEERLRQDDENRKLRELEKMEEQKREKMKQEVYQRRQMLLVRREQNLERKQNLSSLQQEQGITRPWTFSYYVMWPRETYELLMVSKEDKKPSSAKGKKGGKKSGKKGKKKKK